MTIFLEPMCKLFSIETFASTWLLKLFTFEAFVMSKLSLIGLNQYLFRRIHLFVLNEASNFNDSDMLPLSIFVLIKV